MYIHSKLITGMKSCFDADFLATKVVRNHFQYDDRENFEKLYLLIGIAIWLGSFFFRGVCKQYNATNILLYFLN